MDNYTLITFLKQYTFKSWNERFFYHVWKENKIKKFKTHNEGTNDKMFAFQLSIFNILPFEQIYKRKKKKRKHIYILWGYFYYWQFSFKFFQLLSQIEFLLFKTSEWINIRGEKLSSK